MPKNFDMDPRVRDLDLDLDRDRLLRRAVPPKLSIIRLVLDPKWSLSLSLSLLWEVASEAAEASVAVDLPAMLPTSLRPPPPRLAWYARRKEASSLPSTALVLVVSSFIRASQLVSTDALALAWEWAADCGWLSCRG